VDRLKRMRILYSRTQAATGHVTGGALAHTIGVLDGFARLGQLFVLTNEPLHGLDQRISVEVVKPLLSRGAGELFHNLYYPSRLSAVIAEFQPDFVYHRFGGLSYATARVCRQFDLPLVLEFNSSAVWGLRQRLHSWRDQLLAKPKSSVLQRIESYDLHAAFLIVVPGQPLKDHLLERGIPEKRILFNPNAVNPEQFRPAPLNVCLSVKRELGIAPSKTVVGFAGSFSYWHGIPELAEAISRLNADPDRREQLFFVLFGSGTLRPMIESAVGHYQNVLFTGKIEHTRIQNYLSICDILLSPHGNPSQDSRSHGWPGASPTKVFEYMALGKGIVASNLDYLGQVVRNGETGVSISPGDVDALVRGICYLADNPEEAKRLGSNARREVREKHTWEQHTRRIVETFMALKAAGDERL
jgi:glycosyltransferase involved in cell wall biosynthesis